MEDGIGRKIQGLKSVADAVGSRRREESDVIVLLFELSQALRYLASIVIPNNPDMAQGSFAAILMMAFHVLLDAVLHKLVPLEGVDRNVKTASSNLGWPLALVLLLTERACLDKLLCDGVPSPKSIQCSFRDLIHIGPQLICWHASLFQRISEFGVLLLQLLVRLARVVQLQLGSVQSLLHLLLCQLLLAGRRWCHLVSWFRLQVAFASMLAITFDNGATIASVET
mmetsp:Transcript_117055/g.207190  ORF Transcript_117055/g.207190 Transcript_117055/m.207190 type:complete len:226 (+) Transcript_117055:135-812(+)